MTGKKLTESRKANTRLGLTPLAHFKWMLRFIQMDFDTVSAGQLIDVGWEFLTFQQINPMATLVGGSRKLGADKRVSGNIDTGEGELVRDTPPTGKEMRATQIMLHRTVTQFLDTGEVAVHLQSLVMRVSTLVPSLSAHQAFHAPCQLALETPAKSQWGFKVGFLLGAFGHGVRRCPECDTIFLADRKNQQCCQRRCVNRKAQREHQLRKRQARKANK